MTVPECFSTVPKLICFLAQALVTVDDGVGVPN